MENYVLYVINDINLSSNTHQPINSSSSTQLNSSSLIPLIGEFDARRYTRERERKRIRDFFRRGALSLFSSSLMFFTLVQQ